MNKSKMLIALFLMGLIPLIACKSNDDTNLDDADQSFISEATFVQEKSKDFIGKTLNNKDYVAGDVVLMNIQPQNGYQVKKIIYSYSNGHDKIKEEIPLDSPEFKMATGTVNIVVSFEILRYKINVADLENGKVEIKVNNSWRTNLEKINLIPKDQVLIKISALEGFDLLEGGSYINGDFMNALPQDSPYHVENKSASCQEISFAMPSHEITVGATCCQHNIDPSQISYPIAITRTKNGKIKTNLSKAKPGQEIIIKTTNVKPGYGITPGSLKYNGIEIQQQKFVMPQQAVNITAEFSDVRTVSGHYNPLDYDFGTYQVPYDIADTDGADKIRSKTRNYVDVKVQKRKAKVTFHYTEESKITFFVKIGGLFRPVSGNKDYTFDYPTSALADKIWLKNKFNFFPMSSIKPDGSAWTIKLQLDKATLVGK